MADDLTGLKDDMTAFIEGHGMRRFNGYVDYEEVQSVMWKSEDNPESWKDFVELAKAANAPFLTMDSWTLRREDLDDLLQRLANAEFANDEDLEEARWLRTYLGKTGFVQLGFAHQGIMMVYEASTEWYDRYQRVLEMAEDFAGIPIDESDQDDES
jgi:ABC-type taurine transport system substrate-binding protein